MKILIAEDGHSELLLLKTSVEHWGFEVVAATNGEDAWRALQIDNPPTVAILDWMMPSPSGIEICRRARESEQLQGMYIVLLTARAKKVELVEALEAGADDYITKPFNRQELRARIKVGIRISNLQDMVRKREIELQKRVVELENALSKVKQLQGFMPICSYCKKIRDDKNYWQQVEGYIVMHTDARFSHSVCPECYKNQVEPQLKRRKKEKEEQNRLAAGRD